jgi:hypothetical protein
MNVQAVLQLRQMHSGKTTGTKRIHNHELQLLNSYRPTMHLETWFLNLAVNHFRCVLLHNRCQINLALCRPQKCNTSTPVPLIHRQNCYTISPLRATERLILLSNLNAWKVLHLTSQSGSAALRVQCSIHWPQCGVANYREARRKSSSSRNPRTGNEGPDGK